MAKKRKSAHVIMDPTSTRNDQMQAICTHCGEKMILPLPMSMGKSGQLLGYFSRLHKDCLPREESWNAVSAMLKTHFPNTFNEKTVGPKRQLPDKLESKGTLE